MLPDEALEFVRKQGIVLESARGQVPTLTEQIVGGPIGGKWWSHPRAREIMRAIVLVRGSKEVLVCRLLHGKVTYLHCPLWPALVRLSSQLDRKRLAAIEEIHTPSGKHAVIEIPFPKWVPVGVMKKARQLNLTAAREKLAAHGLVIEES